MEALKEKSGKWLLDILEIGKITAKMALEYSFIKMETSMKECGLEIGDMDKVHTGEMKVES